jgi:hypothetical protein
MAVVRSWRVDRARRSSRHITLAGELQGGSKLRAIRAGVAHRGKPCSASPSARWSRAEPAAAASRHAAVPLLSDIAQDRQHRRPTSPRSVPRAAGKDSAAHSPPPADRFSEFERSDDPRPDDGQAMLDAVRRLRRGFARCSRRVGRRRSDGVRSASPAW